MGESTERRKRCRDRIRKKISGTSLRPRLCVFKSSGHIYAQIIDDAKGHTLVAASSLESGMKDFKGHKGNKDAAKIVGSLIGKKAIEKNIKQVVFDRSGYIYHGRVKTLADAAREAGLEF